MSTAPDPFSSLSPKTEAEAYRSLSPTSPGQDSEADHTDKQAPEIDSISALPKTQVPPKEETDADGPATLTPTDRTGPAEIGAETRDATDASPPRGRPVVRAEVEMAGAPSVPGYKILGILGKGGMGVVYRARHTKLRRVVALKMIRDASLADQDDIVRFQTEAEALASLQHPNIVQIYEVGEVEGLPFFSLEFVEGGSLAQKMAKTPQPARWSAEMLETLAQALAAAHRQGIIHRDLKPVNVLLTTDGVPKVTDFGLAKQLDQDTNQTRTGAVMGTPAYMAPEQAAGLIKEVGPLSDIYALGVILYEMLTGRVPFLGESMAETMNLVQHADPVPPRQTQPKVPRDLETICLKCLEKDWRKRYPSAAALAEDLRRFLNNEPIVARPATTLEKTVKWVRRRPTLAASLFLTGIILVGGVTAAMLVLDERANSAERFADSNQRALELLAEGESHVRERKWDAAQRVLESALNVIGNEPRLAAQKQRVETLLAEARTGLAHQEAARQTVIDRDRFLRHRDDVLFYSSEFTGLDRPENIAKAAAAAREGLKLFGLTDGPAVVKANRNLDAADKQQVLDGAAGLYLILARTALQGEEARKAERAKSALAMLDQGERLRPAGAAEHAARFDCLAALGDTTGAERERKLADQMKEDVRAHKRAADATDSFLLGLQQFERGDLDGASTRFLGTLREQPNHFWAQFYLAVCYLRTRQPAQAQARLDSCLTLRSDFIWSYLLRGYAFGEVGAQHRARREPQQAEVCFDAAERDFAKALQMKPAPDEMYVLLVNRGVTRFYAQNNKGAVEDLQEAIRLKPDRFQAYDNLAHVYKEDKRGSEAIEMLNRAIALKPSVLGSLYRTRARLYADQNKVAEALADLDEAIRIGPPGSPLIADDQTERGALLYAQKKYEPALEALDAALKINSTLARAHRLRAETLLQLKRYDDAVRSFDGYLANNGRPTAEVYKVRGLAEQRMGNYAGAIEDYTRALTLRPDDASILTNRGWAYLVNEVPRLAFRDFREALEKDPNNADAYNGRAMARVKLGQHAAAAQDAEDAVKRAPKDARVLYNAARVLAQAVNQLDSDKSLRGSQAADLRTQYQDRALELLRTAIEQAPQAERSTFWKQYVQEDPALNPIRRAPRFTAMVREFGARE